MKKCVMLRHFLILMFMLISNNADAAEVNSNDNITLVPSLELPRKVAKRLIFLKNNISDMAQIPQFAQICDVVEQGQTVIDKDILQAGLQQLHQYSFTLDTNLNSSEADLVKQYTQKIKNDLKELEVILVERALPSCCQNTSCCTAVAPTTKVNSCTKPTCFGKAEETGVADGSFDGKVRINSLAESSDCGSGALVVKGGLGVGGDLNICGRERISNRAPSLDCAHGALVVDGGVGIGLNLNVCGDVAVASTTESTDCTTGASVIAGGQAIGGNLNVCGKLHVFNDRVSRTCDDGALVVDGALGVGQNTNICGLTHLQNTTDSTKCTEGALVVDGGAGFGKNVNICGKVHIFDTTNSGACNSGALVVDGGVGIAKDTNICGSLNVEGVISTNSYFAINGSSVVASNIANCNLSVGDNTNPIANGYSNTAVGESAMQNNQVGVRDTALGCQPLQNNIRGNDDTAIGAQALLNLSGSDRNTACGSQTSFEALDVNDTVAVGYAALHDNQTSQNTAVGSYAMTNNIFGGQDTAVGFEALRNNIGADLPPPIDFFLSPGSSNTAVGHHSQRENLYGFANTSVGSASLQNNFIGFQNVAVGDNTLYFNQAYYNTAVGSDSMYTNTVGIYNTAVGESSLYFNIAGIYNTSIGAESMVYNTVGSWNSVCGFDALTSGIAGFYNCVLGANSLDAVLFPRRNTIVGYHSITGDDYLPQVSIVDNATLGYQTLEKTRTDAQTAIGTQALKDNIYGVRNTACGYQALESLIGIPGVRGYDNTVMGFKAVQGNTKASYNTAVGSQIEISTLDITPSNQNTVIGAIANIVGGSFNVLAGYRSFTSDDSDNNVVVGANAQRNSPNLNPVNDSITIGYNAYVAPNLPNNYLPKGAITIGASSYIQSEEGINIGYKARTTKSDRSITIGSNATSDGIKNILIGPFAEIKTSVQGKGDNVIIGDSNDCIGYGNTAVGSISVINGTYNTLLGYYVNNAPAGGGLNTTLTYSTQLGCYAAAKSSYTTLVGANTVAFPSAAGATLVGAVSKASGLRSVGVGYKAQPFGQSAISIGASSSAQALGSIAIGSSAKILASGNGSVCIGATSSANFNNMVVIGRGLTPPATITSGSVVIGAGGNLPLNTIAINANNPIFPGSITIGSNLGHPPGTGVYIFGFKPGKIPATMLSTNPATGEVYAGPCLACVASGPLEGEYLFEDEFHRSPDTDKLIELSPVITKTRMGDTETNSWALYAPEKPYYFCPELLVQNASGEYLNGFDLEKFNVSMLTIVKKHDQKIKDQQGQISSQQQEINELQQKYESIKTIIDKLLENKRK